MGLLSLTESEKLEILSLHNNAKIIKEAIPEVASPVDTAQVTAQSTPVESPPVPPVDRTSLVSQIQSILKTKYNVDLGTTGPNKDGIDGKLGPKTLQSITSIVAKRQTAPIEVTPITKNPQLGQQTPVAQTIPAK